MGLPEVEVSPVYFTKGLTLGQCCLLEGGQRHQCGTEEEGMQGGRPWVIWTADDSRGAHGSHLELAFPLGELSGGLL